MYLINADILSQKLSRDHGLVPGGTHPPNTLSRNTATAMDSRSLLGVVTIWKPRGRPSELNPSGHWVTGQARALNSPVQAKLKGQKMGSLWQGATLGWVGYSSTPSSPRTSLSSWSNLLSICTFLLFVPGVRSASPCTIPRPMAGRVWLEPPTSHFSSSR